MTFEPLTLWSRMQAMQACIKMLGYSVLEMGPRTMWTRGKQALPTEGAPRPPVVFLIFPHLFTYAYVGVCVCHGMDLQVRGQVSGFPSLTPGGSNSGHQARWQCLYLLSPPPNPPTVCFEISFPHDSPKEIITLCLTPCVDR